MKSLCFHILTRLFVFALIALLEVGCESGGKTGGISPDMKTIADEVLRLMASDPCEVGNPDLCTYRTVTASDPSTPEEGDDVLMIIDAGLATASLALHANRVIAHFSATNGPDYFVPYLPEATFPTVAEQILHETLKGHENFASSKPFQNVGSAFSKKYGKLLEGSALDHGTVSFNLLAELNPDAKFVLVHVDSKFFEVPLCLLGQEGGEIELENFWSGRAERLAAIARTYDVRGVNYSMGYDLRSVKNEWRDQGCSGSRPSDEAFGRFVKMSNKVPSRLAEVPGLLFAQAAPYPEASLAGPERENYLADCESLDQRLRVGFFNLEEAEIASSEERQILNLSEVMQNAAPCTDIFIRDGLFNFQATAVSPLFYTSLGLGHGTINISSTSFIAPVGLAYGLHIMISRGLGPAEFLTWVKGAQNLPLLVSPFASREFSVENELYINWP